MITNIQQLLAVLAPNNHPAPAPETQFYAHLNRDRMEIVAISPENIDNGTIIALPLDSGVALKFMSGEENLHRWAIAEKNGEYTLIKPEKATGFFYNRVDILRIIEVPKQIIDYPDIRLVVDVATSIVEIHYHGERISSWTRPVKFYFTREGDPSYLKCAFSLDVNILDKLLAHNHLEQWPNPICLEMPEIDDLSIYVIKSDLKISLEEKYEISNNSI